MANTSGRFFICVTFKQTFYTKRYVFQFVCLFSYPSVYVGNDFKTGELFFKCFMKRF